MVYKYSIRSTRLGELCAFRFSSDLLDYLAGCKDAADDWEIQVFGATVGTVKSARELSNEEYIADWLKEIADLDKLAETLPNG